MVVRKSFKYFNTQPHFDDDRVEWWFGDATKSLLLLPKEYWGSFDLVLVDLSETVMAMSVTDEMDVFDALALLLKPEGVMVKNEVYLEEMSQVFDYTIQIHYDSPKICSQMLAMGSNKADFFHHPTKDHEIENHLLLPLDKIFDRYEYIHDYRKNDARLQGKCNDREGVSTDAEEQTTAAGIMHIMDVEKTKGDLVLESLLYSAVQEIGLTPVSMPGSSNTAKNVAVVVLKEGYIIARNWPDHRYVAFGINLWGAFNKESAIIANLMKATGSTSKSSFRVVVGGMFNSTTWKADQSQIGPQIVQNRNCDAKDESKEDPVVRTSMNELVPRATLDEFMNLVHQRHLVVGVVCGYESKDSCVTKEIMEQHPRVDKVVTFWACPEVHREEETEINEDENEDEYAERLLLESLPNMFACEVEMINQIDAALSPEDLYFGVFAVDSSAPFEMVQIFNSIWSTQKYRDWYIEEDHNVFLGFSLDPERETFQRNFLDRYRQDVMLDPTSRAEFVVSSGGNKMEVGKFKSASQCAKKVFSIAH